MTAMSSEAAASVAQGVLSMAARHDLASAHGRNAFRIALRQLRGRDSVDDLRAVARSLGVTVPADNRGVLLQQIGAAAVAQKR